jgi:uncharacterized protein
MINNSNTVTPRFAGLPRDASFGVGLRRPHFDGIFENNDGIDFLEILVENFMMFGGRARDVLLRVADRFPIVLHGVNLSIGSIDPLNEEYLARLKDMIEVCKPPWFSDHLSYSSAFGIEYHDLVPLPFSEEVVEHVVGRVKEVQARMGIPFLLENPSYYAELPGAEMTEAEFLKEIVLRSDCGLLLDINNVYVNALNHGYNPREYIDAMPADRVMQYHMAGHDDSGSFLVDTHGTHILSSVYELYEYTLKRVGPVWTLLEWDNNIPSLDVLLQENRYVRGTAARVFGGDAIPQPWEDRP